jgi:ATP:corrinoid adenosyltransferase
LKDGDKEQARLALDCASSAVLSSSSDFVIMDEVNPALDCGLIVYEGPGKDCRRPPNKKHRWFLTGA